MVAEVMGTLEGGVVKLDEALPFPDKTRVMLRVEAAWDVTRARELWQALLVKIDEHPIADGGGPYARE